MRIISGIYRGRRNQRKVPIGVRPTADVVRESIFNILTNLIDFEGKKCLDIFAGTGAMGFEALSRGAKHCTFIEKNRKTSEYIHDTAHLLTIPETDYTIIQADAKRALEIAVFRKEQFDIVFFDPPYKLNILTDVLEKAIELSIFSDDAIITVEHSVSQGFILPKFFDVLQEKVFGDTKVVILSV